MARKDDDDFDPDDVNDNDVDDVNDNDVDDDDDTDDDEDDDAGDDLADMTDAELRDELKKTRDQLTKVNGQSAKRRKALRDKERELVEARKPKPVKKADDADDKPDLDAVREEAKREARAEADDRIKRSEAKAALVSAGVSRDQAADLVAFVKLADLDIDDDGEIDGLDDEIDRIKKKYPTFFAQKRTRRASIAGDGKSSSDSDRRKPLDASAAQAALLTGKTPR